MNAYAIFMNDDLRLVVIGSKEEANTRMEMLRDADFNLNKSFYESAHSYSNSRWYIQAVNLISEKQEQTQ